MFIGFFIIQVGIKKSDYKNKNCAKIFIDIPYIILMGSLSKRCQSFQKVWSAPKNVISDQSGTLGVKISWTSEVIKNVISGGVFCRRGIL